MSSRNFAVVTALSLAIVAVVAWLLLRPGDDTERDVSSGVVDDSDPQSHQSLEALEENVATKHAGGETISGTVLDPRGRALPGVEVVCSRLSGRSRATVAGSSSRAVTDDNGRFSLSGLRAAEYVVETVERTGYVAARHNVTAPSEELVLVLYEAFDVVASGIVTDDQGRRLSDVVVSTTDGTSTRTDTDGGYRLEIRVRKTPGSQLVLSAKKTGYADRLKTVSAGSISNGITLDIPFRLDEVKVGTLAGELVDSEGDGVAGESIHLESRLRSARYQTVSTSDGSFLIENVRTGDDYTARVHPTSNYVDLVVDGIRIAEGSNRVVLELETIETGNLNITLAAADGAPLPDFAVLIRSQSARANTLTATSDADGRFRATDVPVGEVFLETRTLPKVTVRGLKLEPSQELSAKVSIGVGDRTVRGRVTHPDGTPAGGARVVVAWSWRTEWLHSSLFQEALTREDGSFAVAGFGPGSCSITVSGVAIETARANFEIPTEGDPAPLAIEVR